MNEPSHFWTDNTGNLKGVGTLSISRILLICHQVTTTLHPTSDIVIIGNIDHNRQYRVKKYIRNSLTNRIHGKNAQLPLRLDTHISPG